MQNQLAFLFFIIFTVHSSSEPKQINDYKKNYFKILMTKQGFEKVDSGLENIKNETVIFNGFLNQDLYTDIITLSKDKKKLNFHLYNNDNGKYESKIKEFQALEGEEITSIKTAKIISVSEWPNIVIVSHQKNDDNVQTIMRGYEFVQAAAGGTWELRNIDSYKIIANSKDIQEPFNFQIFEQNSQQNYWLLMNEGKRTLYYWDQSNQKINNKLFTEILTKDCNGCQDFTEIDQRQIRPIYSSGFFDINKDCKSDIVLETSDGNDRFLEFFYYFEGMFGFIKAVKIPSNFSMASFQDINSNNLNDIVFFDDDEKSLKFFMNDFALHNKDISNSYCLDKFTSYFPYSALDTMDSKYYYSQKLEISGLNQNEDFGIFEILKFGDVNLDGYVDLLLNVVIANQPRTLLLQNLPCNKEQNPNNIPEENCRYFDQGYMKNELQNLNELVVETSSFLDFGERGKFGLVLLVKENDDYVLQSYLNNFEIENYFLKAIGFLQRDQVSVLNGATFLIKKTELNGEFKVMTRTQNTNCNFNVLCLPFVHFGLEKINNYIEDFKIIVPRKSNADHSWNPIIPNSQLIVYFNPGTSNEFDLNIFINPTSAMFFIFVSTIVVLVLIGIIILILHSREKKIDERFQMEDFNLI